MRPYNVNVRFCKVGSERPAYHTITMSAKNEKIAAKKVLRQINDQGSKMGIYVPSFEILSVERIRKDT